MTTALIVAAFGKLFLLADDLFPVFVPTGFGL